MTLLDFLRRQTLLSRAEEEALYLAVVQELAAGTRREGLWAQAFAESGGNLEAAKAGYLKLRVQSLRDEIAIARQIEDEVARNRSDGPGEISSSSGFNHEKAEIDSRYETARRQLREKGFLIFRNKEGGWDVWSREAGTPKNYCPDIESFQLLARSK